VIKILPCSPRILAIISKHSLRKKFSKQITLLSENPKHPSLHIELLEPKSKGIYSFRINRKYRALFFFRPDKQAIEILAITVHYR
jgi:plasmid maintenance system killer protein